MTTATLARRSLRVAARAQRKLAAREAAASTIYSTHRVRLPDGSTGEVNRLAFNLAMACGGDSYIQCVDSRWILARLLQVIPARPTLRQPSAVTGS